MQIEQSRIEDLDNIFQVTADCASEMRKNGIAQWDENYPTKNLLEKDILSNSMMTLFVKEIPVGMIVMDQNQSPQYQGINWQFNQEPILVVHRLAIDPKFQGQDLGKGLMLYAEEFGRLKGFQSIRLDAYQDNLPLQKFYLNLGYQNRGKINLSYTERPFVCFEKNL